jgi:hypothetical protein
MAGDTFKSKMEEAILLLGQEDEDGADQICVNWILISEWADYKGTRFLTTDVSDSMTPWNAYGMMALAEQYSYDANEQFDDEEEEDY